jgi:hypothetical protein
MHETSNETQNPQEIEQELRALGGKYLDRRRQELEDLMKDGNGFEFIKWATFGHRLKGSAKSYGFEDLGSLGSDLEVAATLKDITKIRPLVENIQTFLFKFGDKF